MVRGDDGDHARARLTVLDLLDTFFAVAGATALLGLLIRRPTAGALLPSVSPLAGSFREDCVLLAVMAYLGTAMVLTACLRAFGSVDDPVVTGLVVNNGAQLAGIVACVSMAVRRVPGGLRTFVWSGLRHESAPRSSWVTVLLLGIAAVGVCPVIRDVTVWLILCVDPAFAFDMHPTLLALQEGDQPAAVIVALWVGAAAVAPVAEEVFFRGVLMNFITGAHGGYGLAVALSSVAFAAVHFSQPQALPALFFLGVLLGIAYARTGSLMAPVAIHAAFNVKTLVWDALERGMG